MLGLNIFVFILLAQFNYRSSERELTDSALAIKAAISLLWR